MSEFIEWFFDVKISMNRVVDQGFFFLFMALIAKVLISVPEMSKVEGLLLTFLCLFVLKSVAYREISRYAGYLFVTDIVLMLAVIAGPHFFIIAMSAVLYACACYCLGAYLKSSGRIKPGKGVGNEQ